MKLVDADADDPAVAPPPPPPPRLDKRRVSVSFVFTVTVLIGCVVAVFTLFPSRHNQVADSALAAHRADAPWDVERPDAATLVAWAKGAVGREPPVPAGAGLVPLGARRIAILRRPAAVIRYQIGADQVTVVLQRARDLQSRTLHEDQDGDRVEAWRHGAWTVIAIGPAASVATWLPLVRGRATPPAPPAP